MKIAIINKSDSTGGAAIVSRRLLDALREAGMDARMLVCEKLSDSPYVEPAASKIAIKWKFLIERLKIFRANGFNKDTLFKIDTGEEGLALWKHPAVREADAILINWVNQGMLSLKGFRKILELGKPVIWTMHDLWEMTGICHHACTCNHFIKYCGECPLLEKNGSKKDLSYKIWHKKNTIYSNSLLTEKLSFVAVSSWLYEKSRSSSLLKEKQIEIIPNAFKVPDSGFGLPKFDSREERDVNRKSKKIRLLFGAARLDDPIKGLDILKKALYFIKEENPDIASRMEIAVYGGVKIPSSLDNFPIPLVNLGILNGEGKIREAYINSDILVSASSYETFGATLVEAQAYGCIPVSFNQGGQGDIIEDEKTGKLVNYSEDKERRARNLAAGILWAIDLIGDKYRHEDMLLEMKKNVTEKFSYETVAQMYISLIKKMEGNR